MSKQHSRNHRGRHRSRRPSVVSVQSSVSGAQQFSGTIPAELLHRYLSDLQQADAGFRQMYPGDDDTRQPVHTVYGGAHLFHSDTPAKFGSVALGALERYAPDFAIFARTIELQGHESLPASPARIKTLTKSFNLKDPQEQSREPAAWFAWTVYQYVRAKLGREPVEDFRIDFEDGYGFRSESEEDTHAVQAARETAQAMTASSLPGSFGIRIKPFYPETSARSIRTLDLFCSTLISATHGRLPGHFVVTLPKVVTPEQVAVLADILDEIESLHKLSPLSIGIELMLEMPQLLSDYRGASALPVLLEATERRCTAVHFGPYDFTAVLGVSARYQDMGHSLCDFARHAASIALAGTGVRFVDGPTTLLPIGIDRNDNSTETSPPRLQKENAAAVHSAWKHSYKDIRHSLALGIYQGWDLHPAQLPIRYAAHAAFFLEGRQEAGERLSSLLRQSAQATMTGSRFDDAATGGGLLNFFLRGFQSGVLTPEDLRAAGLTSDELLLRSIGAIVEARRAADAQKSIGSQVPQHRRARHHTS